MPVNISGKVGDGFDTSTNRTWDQSLGGKNKKQKRLILNVSHPYSTLSILHAIVLRVYS